DQYSDDIAAVIVEPVAGNMGCVLPINNFLQKLRQITEENGALLIFDEVMTGFRVDYYSAQGHFDITPDITTLGKVIGGGLPVGAYGGKREIIEQVAPAGNIYQAGTLSGNPLAMAAGYETLGSLNEQSYDDMNEKVDKLVAGYEQAAKDFNIPLQVNRVGSMLGVFFTDQEVVNYDSAQTSDLDRFAAYYRGMIEEGIFLPPSQFEGLFLSTAHTDEHIEHTIEAVRKVFSHL